MKRVTIIPSHQMTLFGPRITIFTKDGKSYTRQATGREFIWDFDEEVQRIRPGGAGPADPVSAIRASDRGVPRTRSRSERRQPGGFDTRRLSRVTRTGNGAYWKID